MATLPMLLLNGDTVSGPSDWSADLLEYQIVQDIASSSNNGAVAPFPSATADHAWKITDVPGAFQSMSTLAYRVRYSGGGVSDDVISFSLRIVSRTSGTILAAADAAGVFQLIETWSASFIFKNVGPTPFTYVNTTATKSEWDDAEVEFRCTYTVVMADDGGQMLLDAFELSGTYMAVAGSTQPNSLMVCIT